MYQIGSSCSSNMKAKFVNEDMGGVLKPKSEEDVNKEFEKILIKILRAGDNEEVVEALFEELTKKRSIHHSKANILQLYKILVLRMNKRSLNKIIRELYGEYLDKTTVGDSYAKDGKYFFKYGSGFSFL